MQDDPKREPPPFEPPPGPGVTYDAAPPVPARSSRIPWVAFALSNLLLLAVIGVALWSLRDQRALAQQLASASARAAELASAFTSSQVALDEQAHERARLGAELEGAKKQAFDALQQVEKARAELASQLELEIKKGNVLIRKRGGDLVVDVSEQVLFETGEAEISAGGKQVLAQLARSIVRVPRTTFQVSGHTDNARVVSKKVRDKYPTNWELSTARATAVVRFLQERCGVPGERLVSAGYSQYRPKEVNDSEEHRKLNRRIEVALLMQGDPAAATSAAPPAAGQ